MVAYLGPDEYDQMLRERVDRIRDAARKVETAQAELTAAHAEIERFGVHYRRRGDSAVVLDH